MSENREYRTGVKKAGKMRRVFERKQNSEVGKGFKRGAASFYIVAISTLILVIIGASFAAVIISEVTRTSNDDLSQSAYDSALAGVEDAKLALMNYQQCLDKGGSEDQCKKDYLDPDAGCDMVAKSLGRAVVNKDGIEVDYGSEDAVGVLVQESTEDENLMAQYYTCVTVATQTDNYLGFLSEQDQEHSVRIKFADPNAINNVSKVRLSWHSIAEDGDYRNGSGFVFQDPWGSNQTIPATVSLGLVQTSTTFDLADFDYSQGSQTDRGTLYFAPQSGPTNSQMVIGSNEGFVKSNNKDIKNEPFRVNCNTNGEYACSVDAEIPEPVKGNRSSETFVFSVALIYGGPSTHYSLEFYDAAGNLLTLDQVQISIDSTGRANDLFRRVDTRLEPADAAYPYPVYGIEALDPNARPSIIKDFDTTCEFYFDDPTC